MIFRKLMMLLAPEDPKAPATTPAAPPQGTPDPKTPAPKTEPAPATDPKTVLTEPPAPQSAEEIKLAYPEGFTLDEQRSKAFLDVLKKIGVTKSEQAQDLVNFYVEGEKSRDQQDLERITGWAEEAKADKEIGGANWDKSVMDAKRMLDKVGSPDLKKLLSVTGLGNHKEVIRLFAKLGTLVTEDRMPKDNPSTTPVEKSLDDQMQDAFPASPGMFQKQ